MPSLPIGWPEETMQFAIKKCNYDNRNQLYGKARIIFSMKTEKNLYLRK